MRLANVSLLFFLTAMLISGCALHPPIDPRQDVIMQLDDYMIPLAKAVDVVVDSLPPDSIDEVIFSEAVNRSGNPGLLQPFDGYVRKARIEDGYGVILICSQDGKEGIIEDVTCTTRPDTHRPTGSPCDYLLDVKRVCSLP